MNLRQAATLIFLAAVWGASFLFIRVAAPVVGPLVLSASRVLIGGAVLLPLAADPAVRKILLARWRALLLLATVNAVLPYVLVAFAELELTASFGALLNATIPLFTASVAAWYGIERLDARKIAGLLLGMVGVGVLVGWSPVPLTGPVLLAIAASLLGCLCYGIGAVYTRIAFKHAPAAALAVGQQLAAGVILLPFALATLPAALPPAHVAAAMLGLGVLSTGLAYVLFFRLLAELGPTSATSVTLLIPVFGLLWGRLLLAEPIGAGGVAGLAIILVSLVLVTGLRIGVPWLWSSPRRPPAGGES